MSSASPSGISIRRAFRRSWSAASGPLKKAHLLRWLGRRRPQRTASTPRAAASLAVSHLNLFDRPASFSAFHRLALAARNSAFQNRALKPRDIDSLLKAHDGKLIFWATLRGGKADFARFYAPVLLVQQEEIRPTFTQNERTAKADEDGRFTARCMYVFPSEGLNSNAKVLLVVRDPDERQVARFTVDLSGMR